MQEYHAAKLFTGTEWLEQKTIRIADGKIVEIVPLQNTAAKIHPIIAPAFIDIQIYGAYGKLLAVYPEADSLHKLFDYCSRGGASHFQPTVATNSKEAFFACVDAVKAYWKEGGKGCLGLHVEGPWIHPSKKGAHLEVFIHSPSVEEAKELLEYGKGVITMITLAPEMCSKEVVELIRSYGVIISAGHSNATYAEAIQAFDEGITAATHLYNAMSPLQHRAPGIVGAVLDHSKVMASIVPDGFHVDFAAIRIAKKIMGKRLFIITDAVTETSTGPYPHQLAGDRYESNGILSGSALTMAKSVRNLVNKAGIEVEEALRMASLYPAQVMKKADRMGKIEKGYDANLVMLDDSLEVISISNEKLCD
ncbi:MAG: N-acetylglucosamine-6-phosphate deacetylase [Bacteroidota bacterium]